MKEVVAQDHIGGGLEVIQRQSLRESLIEHGQREDQEHHCKRKPNDLRITHHEIWHIHVCGGLSLLTFNVLVGQPSLA